MLFNKCDTAQFVSVNKLELTSRQGRNNDAVKSVKNVYIFIRLPKSESYDSLPTPREVFHRPPTNHLSISGLEFGGGGEWRRTVAPAQPSQYKLVLKTRVFAEFQW